MLTTPVPSPVIDRLYATAERLERAWPDAACDNLGPQMIDAVLRHLDRHPAPGLEPTELSLYAAHLLRRFWMRNARRNAARRQTSLENGSIPTVISLHRFLEEGGAEPAAGLYAPLDHDCCAGEWGRAIVQELLAQGTAPALAWAFVWRCAGLEWEDIAILLHERHGQRIQPSNLRQWSRRYFPRMKQHLRRTFPWMTRVSPDGDNMWGSGRDNKFLSNDNSVHENVTQEAGSRHYGNRDRRKDRETRVGPGSRKAFRKARNLNRECSAGRVSGSVSGQKRSIK